MLERWRWEREGERCEGVRVIYRECKMELGMVEKLFKVSEHVK